MKADIVPNPITEAFDFDILALSVLAPGVPIPVHDTGNYQDISGPTSGIYFPAIAPGQTRADSFGTVGFQLLLQADWVPVQTGGGGGTSPAAITLAVPVAVQQQNFLLRVRDAIVSARELQSRVQQAMQKSSVPLPPSPGPGEWVGRMTYQHPLQRIWARLVTAPGTYEQGMLIDQLSNISRAEGGADQKIGSEARKRFDDLMQELKALQADFERIVQ